MKYLNLDRGWEFRRGYADTLGMVKDRACTAVDLPHDAMIGLPTTPEAPAKHDSGYFPGVVCNYTRYVDIPQEWKTERIGLCFDGVMMYSNVTVNGTKVGEHHYGYSPFFLDITEAVAFGEKNRITVNTDTGVQPSSRWYSGCGLYRSVRLCRFPDVHLEHDGIFIYTREISGGTAWLTAEIDVRNRTGENRIAEVALRISDADGNKACEETRQAVQINPGRQETARISFQIPDARLWDPEQPNLYTATVTVTNLGTFGTHFVPDGSAKTDEAEKQFGVRTVTADATRGLRVNGKTVKLRGGCVHHDNGLLGAVSLYESEVRKLRKLKETGFNAIRTAHNPPSEALLEACDRVGMFIFDEAFDAWGVAKRPGDFSTFFDNLWEQEITAFVRRDRIHPSVIIWSTGNEIPERGGLNNGYTLASRLAEAVRKLDPTRPVSNGICSFWCGVDDFLAQEMNGAQNAQNDHLRYSWDRMTEPFTNGLDIVGYNYMEDLYENSHKLFPNRVILGSENFPKEIGFRWPLVESLPYVIGDFTWTAWDYIGEAGIGKSVFFDPGDPDAPEHPWDIMPDTTSPYPWRLANDADYDITGRLRPQGAYRSVVWGNGETHLYAQHPDHCGKTELTSMWGFPDVLKSWNFAGYEGKPVELTVFTNAEEVALVVNGRETDRKPVGRERPLPCSVQFRTAYVPGTVEAVSYRNGTEISRDRIETSGVPAKIRITPEKTEMRADGHDVIYAEIEVLDEQGRIVPDASLKLNASVRGTAVLAGFGTGNPVTDEDYTDSRTVSFGGHALAILRSGYETGETTLTVEAADAGLSAECTVRTE